MTIKPISLDLAKRLTNERFRGRFLETLARDEIASQIRQLRVRRGFVTQTAFAKKVGMQQSAVSRIEQADYSGWTFRTLLKVASALDARLRVTFEPIESVIETARRSESAAQLEDATTSDATWRPQGEPSDDITSVDSGLVYEASLPTTSSEWKMHEQGV